VNTRHPVSNPVFGEGYIHAERLLAKAGGASASGGGSPTLETMRGGSEKGGAKRRAAQAKRGSVGKPVAGARGGAPLRSFCGCDPANDGYSSLWTWDQFRCLRDFRQITGHK
jgi:hypothetical protein